MSVAHTKRQRIDATGGTEGLASKE